MSVCDSSERSSRHGVAFARSHQMVVCVSQVWIRVCCKDECPVCKYACWCRVQLDLCRDRLPLWQVVISDEKTWSNESSHRMMSHEALRESNKLHHCATIVWASDSNVCAWHINKYSADIKIQQESKSNENTVLSKTVGDSTAILIKTVWKIRLWCHKQWEC